MIGADAHSVERRGAAFDGRTVARALPVLITVAIALAAWYGIIWTFRFKEYILPAPHEALQALVDKRALLMRHSFYTLMEAFGGFVVAILFGVPCAVAIVWSQALERAIMPVLVFSQTFPKAAIAPLLVIWFGFGLSPKVLVAFLIAYFPIVMSMVVGMRAVETDLVELIRSCKASPLQVFTKIRIPYSLPFVFSGLKTAAAFALTGAVVGEWVGADRGLGFLLTIANADLNTRLTFAILLLLMVYGFVWFSLLSLVERWLIPWHVSVRDQELSSTL
jgi:NitT/TauT family transport system permease protein